MAQVASGAGVGLLVHLAQVIVDGSGADEEPFSDLGVGVLPARRDVRSVPAWGSGLGGFPPSGRGLLTVGANSVRGPLGAPVSERCAAGIAPRIAANALESLFSERLPPPSSPTRCSATTRWLSCSWEEAQQAPEPSDIDLARLEEEHRRQLEELRRQEEEHRRETEELRRQMEPQEEAPPETT